MVTTITDFSECSRGDYFGVVVTWQSGRKHGVQGVFSADAFTSNIFFAGSQVGTLCQSSTSCDIFG